MRKGFRQLIALGAVFAVTTIYLNGTRLLAPTDPNSTYLTNLRYDGSGGGLNEMFFGDHGRWSSMDAYVQLANEYEYRRNYGLLNQYDEARYHQTFQNLARNALNDLEGYHFGKARSKVQGELDEIPTWYAIRTSKSPPVVIMGVLAAAYSGQLLRYRLNEESSVESRTGMTSSHLDSQYFGWSSALLGASVGSTYDSSGIGVSLRKSITAGVSMTYEQASDRAIGMSYSTGF